VAANRSRNSNNAGLMKKARAAIGKRLPMVARAFLMERTRRDETPNAGSRRANSGQ